MEQHASMIRKLILSELNKILPSESSRQAWALGLLESPHGAFRVQNDGAVFA